MSNSSFPKLFESKGEEYRAKAAECDVRARRAISARQKYAYEEAARQWRKLADEADNLDR